LTLSAPVGNSELRQRYPVFWIFWRKKEKGKIKGQEEKKLKKVKKT